MKTCFLYLFLFLSAFTIKANAFIVQPIDTPDVQINFNNTCPGTLVFFSIVNKTNIPLDSLWWKGDYDSVRGYYSWDRRGKATDINIANPIWIFGSSDLPNKYPFTLEVKDVLGNHKTFYDTVETGIPVIQLMDSVNCCGISDSISFKVKFLSKPYNTVAWYDNTTNQLIHFGNYLQNFKLPVSMISGKSTINLKVVVEDPVGCKGYQYGNYSISTGFNTIQKNIFSIIPNPSYNFIQIEGLVDNTSYDVVVLDIFGNQILTQKIQSDLELDISTLNKGVYFIKINNSFAKFIKD